MIGDSVWNWIANLEGYLVFLSLKGYGKFQLFFSSLSSCLKKNKVVLNSWQMFLCQVITTTDTEFSLPHNLLSRISPGFSRAFFLSKTALSNFLRGPIGIPSVIRSSSLSMSKASKSIRCSMNFGVYSLTPVATRNRCSGNHCELSLLLTFSSEKHRHLY